MGTWPLSRRFWVRGPKGVALSQGGCFDQLSFVLFPVDKDRVIVLFLELNTFLHRVFALSFKRTHSHWFYNQFLGWTETQTAGYRFKLNLNFYLRNTFYFKTCHQYAIYLRNQRRTLICPQRISLTFICSKNKWFTAIFC